MNVFQVSADEAAHSLLITTFRLISPDLGKCIQNKLSQIYGEELWRRKAGENLSQGMFSRLEDTRRRPLKDIFLICELILYNVEVLSVDMVDIDGVRPRSVWLERLVEDVDLVNQTRTLLFHAKNVSVSEVLRCLVRLERLCRRLPHLVLDRKKDEELQQHLQASSF